MQNLISSFEVRKVTLKDYKEVFNLMKGVTRCTSYLTEEELREKLKVSSFHPYCILDTENDKIIAYASLYILPHLCRPNDARLEHLIVSTEYRNRGIGTFLCKHIIDEAKNKFKCSRLDLTVECEIAKALYTNLGFEFVDTKVMRQYFIPPTKEST
ncbi:acetyltransferase, GNAT family protein [Cryptosporidium serpentis]